jgi:hypothetical protein
MSPNAGGRGELWGLSQDLSKIKLGANFFLYSFSVLVRKVESAKLLFLWLFYSKRFYAKKVNSFNPPLVFMPTFLKKQTGFFLLSPFPLQPSFCSSNKGVRPPISLNFIRTSFHTNSPNWGASLLPDFLFLKHKTTEHQKDKI